MLFGITVIICFLSSALLKKTKFIGFLALMVFAFLAGDANLSTTLDYQVYMNHYNLLGWETSPFEKGYTLLSSAVSHAGYTYAQFRMFFAVLALLILFMGLCLFTDKIALFAGIYGCTVFFNDATQIRNLMMISLVVLGAGLLAKEKYVFKILGVAVLLLSTQFHDLGFVFAVIIIPLSFLNMESIQRLYKYWIIGLYLLGAVFAFSSNVSIVQLFATLLTKFSSRSNSAENVLTNFGRGNSLSTIIMMWMTLFLLSILITELTRACLRTNVDREKVKILYIGSAISMVVAFFIVLAPDYSRISRNAFVFVLILLCVTLEQKTIVFLTKQNLARLLLLVGVITLTTYINIQIWGPSFAESLPYLAQLKK
ncbi:EpsG family protein [Lactiplantibacillus pentosus]